MLIRKDSIALGAWEYSEARFLEVKAERLNIECCLSDLDEERSRVANGGGGGNDGGEVALLALFGTVTDDGLLRSYPEDVL